MAGMKLTLYSNKHNYHYLYAGENLAAGWSMLDQLKRDGRDDGVSVTYDCPAGNGPRFLDLKTV